MNDLLSITIVFLSFYMLRYVAARLEWVVDSSGSLTINRFKEIDGLRGILAFCVFIHHFFITWHWKVSGGWGRPPELYLHNMGKVSVILFFMVTGYLFSHKMLEQKFSIAVKQLAISRLHRVLPLYFVILLAIVTIVAYKTQWELHESLWQLISDVLKWLLFHGQDINGFAETRRIIAGVDWTLKYEWMFYMSLPFMAVFFRKWPKVTFFILTALSIGALIFPFELWQFKSKFVFCFFVGGVSAYIESNSVLRSFVAKHSGFWSVIAFMIVLVAIFFCPAYSISQMLLSAVVFFLIVQGVDFWGALTSRGMLLLGEISFSVYLLHALLLYLVFTVFIVLDLKVVAYQVYLLSLPVFMLLVFFVSLLTYKYIEKPFIDIGRKRYCTV